MFAGRSGAEIPARHQDARACIARFIQNEVRVLFSVRAKSPVIKQKLAEAGALDPLQKLLGDDLIGVDVDPVQRSHAAAMNGEWFHCFNLTIEISNLECL